MILYPSSFILLLSSHSLVIILGNPETVPIAAPTTAPTPAPTAFPIPGTNVPIAAPTPAPAPAPVVETPVEEASYQSVPETLLPPVNQFLPTFQPLRDSNNQMNFSSHIPKDSLFTSGFYPPPDYPFQPAMNPLDYNPTFMPSMPFSTFNDFGYPFNHNTQQPEVFDLYSDIKGIEFFMMVMFSGSSFVTHCS